MHFRHQWQRTLSLTSSDKRQNYTPVSIKHANVIGSMFGSPPSIVAGTGGRHHLHHDDTGATSVTRPDNSLVNNPFGSTLHHQTHAGTDTSQQLTLQSRVSFPESVPKHVSCFMLKLLLDAGRTTLSLHFVQRHALFSARRQCCPCGHAGLGSD